MNYQDFEEKILIALYQERMSFGVSDIMSFRELAEKYAIPYQEGWLIECQKDLRRRGHIAGPPNGHNDEMAVGKILPSGMRRIEEKYGSKDGVGIVMPIANIGPATSAISKATGNIFIGDGPPPADFGKDGDIYLNVAPVASTVDVATALRTFDSAAWTGVSQKVQANPQLLDNIAAKISEIEDLIEISSLDNQRKSSARAISKALVALVSDPEPEWKVIVELLNSPKLTAVLNFAQVAVYIFAALGFGS